MDSKRSARQSDRVTWSYGEVVVAVIGVLCVISIAFLSWDAHVNHGAYARALFGP